MTNADKKPLKIFYLIEQKKKNITSNEEKYKP
jgi:hypothetical protein